MSERMLESNAIAHQIEDLKQRSAQLRGYL